MEKNDRLLDSDIEESSENLTNDNPPTVKRRGDDGKVKDFGKKQINGTPRSPM
jgi:hypothetical protein